MIATQADIPLILDLCREAHGKAMWSRFGAEFCRRSCEESCRFLMDDEDGAVFVADRGTLWVKRFPMIFNHAQIVASDVFFYATKNGDALRREAEKWVGDGGLISLSRHGNTDARVNKLYARAGYDLIEQRFLRRLS